MEILMLLIGLALGAFVGALATAFLARRRPATVDPRVEWEHARVQEALRAEAEARLAATVAAEREVQADVRARLAAAEAAMAAVRGHLEQQQAQQRADQQERAEREKQEHRVLEALSPVRKTLEDMQAKIAEGDQQRHLQFGSLAEQLKQAAVSDEQLRKTTESLAGALRSNSTRGVWGETQLRRVVEAAGMLKHVDFAEQSAITTENGVGRPDLTIQLPAKRYVPVDAKVPLEHYLAASEIPETATDSELARRKALLNQHVKAMRGHVAALAKRRYWEGYDSSPELVVAFIPTESLLAAALAADPTLLDFAFANRVILASPVNLFALLKTVDYTWQQAAVSEQARTLVALGSELYRRIGVVAGRALKLRKALENSVSEFNAFASSFESRVLVTARKFPGIDTSQLEALSSVPPIDTELRGFTAPELAATAAADTEAPETQREEVGPTFLMLECPQGDIDLQDENLEPQEGDTEIQPTDIETRPDEIAI